MHHFEKLLFWQKSMVLAKNIYLACQRIHNDEKFGLISQIKRSVVSIHRILLKVQAEIVIKNLIIFWQLL